jgi:putative endonuclease
VKARGAPALAAESLGARQRARIALAAERFLARRPELAGLAVRFDAVLLGGRLPRHVADAWRDSAG